MASAFGGGPQIVRGLPSRRVGGAATAGTLGAAAGAKGDMRFMRKVEVSFEVLDLEILAAPGVTVSGANAGAMQFDCRTEPAELTDSVLRSAERPLP